MSWSKVTDATNDETALISALDRLDRHRQNRWGLELRLSALKPYHQRPHHQRVVRKLLVPLQQRFEASIFQLSSGDLFLLMLCPDIGEIKPVILNIRMLFAGDPLLADKSDDEVLELLCPVFNLQEAYDSCKSHVLAIAEQRRTSRLDGTETSAKAVLGMVSPQQVSEIERSIRNANLANLLRRQAACVVAAGVPPSPVFHELFFSTADLAQLIVPGYELTSNKWLFQHLTTLLDQRMLSLLSDRAYRSSLRNASVNLTLKTILSQEFLDFDTQTNIKDRGSLAIELPFIDVMSEPADFLFASDLLHMLGYKIILDGVRHEVLPLINRDLLGIDMVKVLWEPSLRDHAIAKWSEPLHAAIQQIGRERICLCRVDAPEAIDVGRSLGISLFQGRLIDGLAQERKSVSAATA